jgi:Fur family ferric uptake transcriptional regulator
MEESSVLDLFTRHGLKPTANRVIVVKALAQAGRPLTLSELVDEVRTIDKSNIFRALTAFREHHLVHVIEDGGDAVRYELCNSREEDEDLDLHVHFYCENCHRTFCLENTPIPPVALAEGFQRHSANYVVKGLCPDCAKKVR